MDNNALKFIFVYLLIINILGFFSMWLDKRRAIKNAWRTPEKTLFIFAILGGSIGSILGMQVFRHKTKHLSFAIGMPAILILQVAICGYFIFFK